MPDSRPGTTTTIPVDSAIRDRLRTYGHAGMTYNEILRRLMDEVDRDAFVAEMRRRADPVKNWIDLDDAG
jgi:hypothetical protein